MWRACFVLLASFYLAAHGQDEEDGNGVQDGEANLASIWARAAEAANSGRADVAAIRLRQLVKSHPFCIRQHTSF